MSKVAILGAGLAGLGAAWHMLQNPRISVTVFDPKGIGGGASGVSTGLLHPFPGRLALHSWQADAGMRSTHELIVKIEEHLGRRVAQTGGILRLAVTEQQQRDFVKNCLHFGCQWWCAEKVKETLPEAAFVPALWIPQGMAVYAKPYLEGLWQLCEAKGAKLKREIFCDHVEQFDRIVLAMGDQTPQAVIDALGLVCQTTRGQALLCRRSGSLAYPLLSQGHITATENPDYCLLGSTYENPNTSPSQEKALGLKQKIAQGYPPAQEFEVVQIQMGYRIARKQGYRPIVAQIDPKTWVFFGLGSRGLLYHSWLGKFLAENVINSLMT